MKKTLLKKAVCLSAVGCLSLSCVAFNASETPYLSKYSNTVSAGKSFTLRVLNNSKKVRWSTNNRKVAKVISTKGKYHGAAKIKAVKSGSATITAKVGAKTLKCRITVKRKISGGGITVYIANTGNKYHISSCRFLRRSKNAVSLSWAKANGYEPCKVCNPHP